MKLRVLPRFVSSVVAVVLTIAASLAAAAPAAAQTNPQCLCKARPEGGVIPPTPSCVTTYSFTIERYDGMCTIAPCTQARMCRFVPRIRATGVDASCVFAVTLDNVPQMTPTPGFLSYSGDMTVSCDSNRALRVFAGNQLLLAWNLRCIQCPLGIPTSFPQPPGYGGGPGGDGSGGGEH